MRTSPSAWTTTKFGYDFVQGHCQTFIVRPDRPPVYFEANHDGSRWIAFGSETIAVTSHKLFPRLKLGISRNEDQTFSFKVGGSISSKTSDSQLDLDGLLQSKWFASKAGIHELFVGDFIRRRGAIPASFESNNGRATVRWLHLKADLDGFEESEYVFSDGGLVSIDSPDAKLTIIDNFENGSSRLQPLEWPDFPAEEVNIDTAKIMKLVENINCLLYTSPSPRDQRGSRMPSSA